MRNIIIIMLLSIFISSCLFAQWELVSGTEDRDIRTMFNNNGVIYLGLAGYQIWKSDDAGQNWTELNNGLDAVYVKTILLSSGKIFAGTEQGVFVSLDGGENWTKVNPGFDFKDVRSIRQVGGNIYACGTGGLFLSQDDGDNWVNIGGNLESQIINDIAANGSYLYAVGGCQYISADNGQNWELHLGNFTTCTLMNKLIVYNGLVYAGTHGLGVYTISEGNNWHASNAGAENVQVLDLDSRDSIIVISTQNHGVFLSDNYGQTWSSIKENLPGNFSYDVMIHGNYIYCTMVATGQDGLYRRILDPNLTATDDIPEKALDNQFQLKQNYPNPFNPGTTIEFSIPSSGFVNLEILDPIGNKVETLLNENLEGGLHKVVWNAENYSSGIYFYRIRTNKFTKTKKLILLK